MVGPLYIINELTHTALHMCDKTIKERIIFTASQRAKKLNYWTLTSRVAGPGEGRRPRRPLTPKRSLTGRVNQRGLPLPKLLVVDVSSVIPDSRANF